MPSLSYEPVLTTLPKNDPRRFIYTYIGRRLLEGQEPIYYYDLSRTRPSLIVGTTGSGKTELMASLALMDSAKGRAVIFIDGKCDLTLMNKLYYWSHHVFKRDFFCLIPHNQYDHLSHSWNPLFLTTVDPSTISESVFNSFEPPGQNDKGAGIVYSDFQRHIFQLICSALLKSGRVVNFQDINALLTHSDIMESIQPLITAEGIVAFKKLLIAKREKKREFSDWMLGFSNFLGKFSHWTLNSYNPTIQFDRLVYTDSFIYVGLPLNLEPHLMRAVGNVLVNQLKSLSHRLQGTPGSNVRRSVSCYIDEAGSFIDTTMVDWVNKVRSTGLILHLAIQLLADLKGRHGGFAEQIPGNTPNVFFFQTQDPATANWFSELSGRRLERTSSANVVNEDGEAAETGAGLARLTESNRVPRDLGYGLRPGQLYFLPSSAIQPMLLAGSFFPDPPARPDRQYTRPAYNARVEVSGLHLNYLLTLERQKFEAARARVRATAEAVT